jgi:PAS domain S-box-containing protein
MPARAMLDLFRAVFENTTDAVVVANSDGEIILFNHSAAEIYGAPIPQTLKESPVNFGMHVGDGSRLLAVHEMPMFRALKGERVRDFHIVLRNEYVGERKVIVDSDPIHDETNRIVGGVVRIRISS